MKVQSLYTVGELAKLCGFRPRRMRRWLARENVRLVRSGQSVVVPLVSFRDAFPEVWESIRLKHRLEPAPCAACGGSIDPAGAV